MLKESEERYRAIFEQALDGILLVDGETGELIDFNDRVHENLGYTHEEFKKLKIPDFEVSESAEEVAKHTEKIVRKGYDIFKTKHRTKDGEIREIMVSSRAISIGERDFALSICRDTTKHKQAEKALRKYAEEFAALYETSLDITKTHDLSTLLETIVKRATQLLNCSSGGLYICDPDRKEARVMVSYNTPHDYTGTVLKYGEGAAGIVAQTGEPLIIDDYRTWSKRATVFEKDQPFSSVISVPMIWQDDVIGVIHVLNYEETRSFTQSDLDLLTLFASQAVIAVNNARLVEQVQSHAAELQKRVIEVEERTAELEKVNEQLKKELEDRAQTEEALRESEEMFRLIAETSPDYIYHVDTEGTIIYVSSAVEQILGYKPQELIGKNFLMTIPPDAHSDTMERFQIALSKKRKGIFENIHIKKSGELVYVETHAAVMIKDGKIVGLQGITRDITERKQTEEKI